MNRYHFHFDIGDSNESDHLNKYYIQVSDMKNTLTSKYYYASDFLQNKLEEFKNVEYLHPFLIWKLDQYKICKMYFNYTQFNRVIEIQKLLSDYGIGCKLLETWVNPNIPEYFIISEYGGQNLYQKYPDDHPTYVDIILKSIKSKLNELKLIQIDWHLGNFVENDQGVIKIIDYDTIYPKDNVPHEMANMLFT